MLGNKTSDNWLSLTPFWEVHAGPSLHKRKLGNSLPVFHEWTIEHMHVILIGAPLQNLIVDAIVISNDPFLRISTFTAASVAQVAGDEFRQQAQGKQVEFGGIVSTPGGSIAAR